MNENGNALREDAPHRHPFAYQVHPVDVKTGSRYNLPPKGEQMPVKLILRDQEYEVKPGMTLRHSLLKIGVQPEAVLAIRQGQMITEDEILKDEETIKLIAVISGGAL